MSCYYPTAGLLACMLAVTCLEVARAHDIVNQPYPQHYVIDYPDADRCIVPIRSTFYEVTKTVGIVRGKRFRQKPNGGYGLPVIDKVGGKNLLHVGADLGWYQVGEPVMAIANGVVRESAGPSADTPDRNPRGTRRLPWGNFVAIEHHFPREGYFTSLYGHLGVDRRVKVGDIVRAGQPIGTIGRQHVLINGGYKPHLHFGVREGRLAEVGGQILLLSVNGRPQPLILKKLGRDTSEVRISPDVPLPLRINCADMRFEVRERAGKAVIESSLLWRMNRPDFALVGYALSTDGWRDPVRFVKDHSQR